ncbi:unnamed protein product [Cuscuta campestris]|uniref:F-box domain-containing protein n=1 Tax=Cuscuta campestris TaxID=132261 RepID=A0A484L1G1_9ASTE|nr:unnamed protein product [Cuscuta campestris]
MEKIEGEELVLVEILTRLPVKSLGRFKSVSKKWLSLISDPHFVKSHLRRSLENCPSARHRILISDPLHSVDFNGNQVKGRISPPKSFEQPFELAGSCNGLICLYIARETFAAINPTTGETRELPKPTHIPTHANFFNGFGYDATTDDYKVVRGPQPTIGPQPEFIVEMFSFKANSWKRIEYDPELKVIENGFFFNGCVHWLVTTCHGNSRYEQRVVSLDLADEKFRVVIPLPDVAAPNVTFNGLNIIEGCFSTFSGGGTFGPDVEPVEVWVMREYGVKSSWTRLCRFTPHALPKTCYLVTLLCFRDDGKVIFDVGGSRLVVYNPCNDNSRVIFPKSKKGSDYFYTVVYVESLVSPN